MCRELISIKEVPYSDIMLQTVVIAGSCSTEQRFKSARKKCVMIYSRKKPKSNIKKCRKYNNFPFEPQGIQYNHVIEPSTCSPHHSQPLPTVSWKRVRTEITDQFSETDPERGVVRNEMVIDALKREDLLTEVICQASNTNLTAPITASVKLDISCKMN
ncbi:UNVERIFIED_CONTAM: hypothetical protein NCL1_04061 [Trichonephila clavipes]